MNRLNDFVYLTLTGLVTSAGFCSFYYSVTVPHYYLYLAVLAQFASGAALFLIKNKTAVGITNHLQGNISKSSTLWEAFFSGGEAIGAYIGSWLDAKIGFSLTMTVAGITLLVAVFILACCYPSNKGRTEESDETPTRDIYLLYVSRDLLIYCWGPMICIGAVMVNTEGILTEFYLEEFSKSLQFGGSIIGVSSIVYRISAALIAIGMLREAASANYSRSGIWSVWVWSCPPFYRTHHQSSWRQQTCSLHPCCQPAKCLLLRYSTQLSNTGSC